MVCVCVLITTVAIQAPHSCPAAAFRPFFYFVGNHFFYWISCISSRARIFPLSLALNTRFFPVKRKTVVFFLPPFFFSCVELLALLSTMFALLYSQKRYFLLLCTTITQRAHAKRIFTCSFFPLKILREKIMCPWVKRWLGQTETQQGKGCFLLNTENWKSDV